LIQVCADPATADARERELRALAAASKAAPKMPVALLVLTQEQAAALAGNVFRVLPAYEMDVGRNSWDDRRPCRG